MSRGYVGLYGNVAIPKEYCVSCQAHAFVLGGKLHCCGAPVAEVPVRYKRESEPEQRRRLPPMRERREQLAEQDYCCFYCFRRFGSRVEIGHRVRVLRVQWDHLIPFAYAQDNRPRNFVAACDRCNAWKSDRCFMGVDEARMFLTLRWEQALATYDTARRAAR